MIQSRHLGPLRFLLIIPFSLALSNSSIAAKVPALTDTINPLPGPPSFNPNHLALNNVTKRVYVGGGASEFQAGGRLTVIDAQTNTVVHSLSLPWQINNIAVNETTNTVYVNTYSGPDGSHLQPVVVVIDGATNQIIKQVSSNLGRQIAVLDPTSGRLFGFDNFSGNTVSVWDGNTLSKVGDVVLTFSPLRIAINPATGQVYVTGSVNDQGKLAVIDPALSVAYLDNVPVGQVITVDPTVNRGYMAGIMPNGSGGYKAVLAVFSGNSLIKTIDLPQEDIDTIFNGIFSGATIDPVRHRAYLSIGGSPARRTEVVDTQNNTLVGTLTQDFLEAGVLASTGQIYATQLDAANALFLQNAIGVIDPGNSAVQRITVGYKPYALAINSTTGRVYVADQQAAELLVFNTSDHALLARIPVQVSDRSTMVNDEGSADVAVSQSLNRVYLPRTVMASDFTSTGTIVQIIDGVTNAVVGSIPVSSSDYAKGYVAVDDTRHRLYVTGRQGNNNNVFVYNTDSNSLVTTIPLPFTPSAIAAHPGAGRVYVDGYTGLAGDNVAIIDTNSNQFLKTVTAGANANQIAINSKTNKVYVGAYDNTITVIDGATDSVETTFSNTDANNRDAVAGVGVDDLTNTLYAADDSNQFDATGRATFFDPAKAYQFLGQVELGHYPGHMAFDSATRQMFIANNFTSGYISVLGNGAPIAPPAPLHGGLSETIFRINGSKNPTNNAADTALHFAAQQSGTPAGLKVRVQINTAANNDANDWVDLDNGSNGYMTIDQTTGQFVLSSTNYPLANGLYFRALSTAPGYPDSRSNIIGPFNLSATQNHLGTTILYVATNGGGQEMKFRGKVGTDQAGITLRVQSTTSPDDDSSWTDLNDGNSGGMHSFADPKQFYLDTTNYPAGDVVYFRAVATAPGFLNSLSNIIGITHVVTGTPPEVSAFPSTLDQLQPGSGSGTSANDPLILALGSLKFSVQASSPDGKALEAVAMIYDGSTINKSEGNGVSGTLNTDYTTSVPGDHVIKAFATDDRGVTGYADPVYLRILPPNGKIFTMVNSGDWSDAKNWQDSSGQNGVPGGNDVAIVGTSNATITQAITAYAVSLLGGSLNGSGGSLTVSGMLSVVSGQLRNVNLTIDSHGTLAIVGDNDVPISGSVNNLGKIKILGAGSIVPVTSSSGSAMRDGNSPLAPAGLFDGIAAFFKNAGDFIFHHPSVKPKPKAPPQSPPVVPAPRGVTAASFDNQGRLITNDGGSIITHDGGSIITHDGGSLITNDGGSIIGNDGASLITNDGGSVISRDGAGLITNDGGSLITNDGGSLLTRPNSTSANLRAATSASGFTQSAGEINLNHLLILAPMTINGGVLRGGGVIAGDLTNNSGFISPGNSAGTITVLGNFAQAADGTLIVENGGPIGGQSDMLQIAGSATLGGRLDIKTIGSYVPNAADTFSPLSYNAVSGSMSISSNAQVTVNATGAQVTINPAIPGPSSGQPLNIATRLAIQSGDNALFAGFIVTGPSGSTKKVMIRGIGPSLANFGIAGTIADPLLELHQPDGSVVVNDDWQQGDTSQIPNGFAPSDSRESVIVATLTPGTYSVVVRGAHGETGVGLAEVYDLETGSAAKLANIATRGFVQTGDNILIGGFIIGGTEPAKVLVRAIGPSLAAFGVLNTLPATTLELHDANGSAIRNEGWRSTQESDIVATTIPPSNDNEAAILATLVPGTYTAVLRGNNDTTGIGVIEAYNLQ